MLSSTFRLMVILSLVASSFFVRADDQNTSIKSTIPIPDLSTPESTLNYYWRLKDWESKTFKFELAKLRATNLETAKPLLIKLTTGEAKQYFSKITDPADEVLDRTIKQVSYENDKHSTIVASIKNMTPIPEGVKPSKYDEEERKLGVDFRYIFQKEGAEWKISEVWRLKGGMYPVDRMILKPSTPFYPSHVFSD